NKTMNVIDPSGVVQADVARTAAVRNLKWLWPLALLASALVIRYFFMMGLGGSDDTAYMLDAMQLAAGKPPASFNVGSVRAAFLVWLAVWDYLGFGGSELLFPQLMVEVALVGAIYWVGRRFVDERAALFAATCWILFPIEL